MCKKVKISVSIEEEMNNLLENNHINKSKLINDLLLIYFKNNESEYKNIKI